MNRKQKQVLLWTAAIIGLMILFPPYVIKNYKHVVFKSGYGFIFDLPPHVLSATRNIPAMVNVSTLFIQMLGVLIVGGLIYIALKKD